MNQKLLSLRVMLFQIDIKLIMKFYGFINMFESNVILDRYKTQNINIFLDKKFESNVILDRYKT